mmetsp:Transcript_147792/g.474416  ORF Transcript_147792/g.474416 Transcript_147792/m.474416 type:complete len:279 (+) Transcript_147792:400-1236(+)
MPEGVPKGTSWAEVSEPTRLARRLAQALHNGGRDRAEAEAYFRLAFQRSGDLERKVRSRSDGMGPGLDGALAQLTDNLAGHLIEFGHTVEAMHLLQRPRPLSAGARHGVDELMLFEHMATMMTNEGRLPEAENFARKAFEGMEAAFPPGAQDIRPAAARARLAHVLHLRGYFEEAEHHLRQAFSEYESSLGQEHPHTLGCARNLAVLLKQVAVHSSRSHKLLQEAQGLLQRASDGYASTLGSDHPDAQRAARNVENFRLWRTKVTDGGGGPASRGGEL